MRRYRVRPNTRSPAASGCSQCVFPQLLAHPVNHGRAGHFRGHEGKELVGDFKNAGREWRAKSPTNSASTSKFTTSRRERANGTRLVPAKAGIEHRLFSLVTMNWRARPLVSYQVIVELISSTTTETGPKVLCELAPNPTTGASPSPTTRWPLSISPGPISTANGIRHQTAP